MNIGRMSDQNETIRTLSTHTFADLIQVMPLESGIPNPPKLSPKLLVLKNEQRQFVEQLFNPSTIPDYKVPVPISAELRSYQQVKQITSNNFRDFLFWTAVCQLLILFQKYVNV